MFSKKEINLNNTIRNESLQLYIKSLYPTFSSSEKRVSDFITNNIRDIPDMSITAIADKCSVSEATIIRFTKKIGCTGYSNMKIELAKTLFKEQNYLFENKHPENNDELIIQTLNLIIKNISDTFNTIDKNILDSVVDLIINCSGIYFFAAGGSIPIALAASHKIEKLGIKSFCPVIPEEALTVSRNLKPTDIVFGITHSGESKLVNKAFLIASEKNVTKICLTNYQKSKITNISDYCLFTSTHNNIFNEAEVVNRSAESAIIDLIFNAIVNKNKTVYKKVFIRSEMDASYYNL